MGKETELALTVDKAMGDTVSSQQVRGLTELPLPYVLVPKLSGVDFSCVPFSQMGIVSRPRVTLQQAMGNSNSLAMNPMVSRAQMLQPGKSHTDATATCF